jgi:hypothetical protein
MTSFTNETNIKAISDVAFHSKDYIYSLEVNKKVLRRLMIILDGK